MARRELEKEEAALWATFARDIQPLKSRRARRAAKKPEASTAVVPSSEASPSLPPLTIKVIPARVVAATRPAAHPTIEIGARQPGLDDTSWRALSTGRMSPQRRLDLHGHFAQDAFERLHTFLLRSSAQGLRCVEVVTGLGSGRDGGVIRRELPHWLARGDLRPLVLAVVHTHARNKGAVRILLRRRSR
ncbi:DNA mismatch repair protein Smr/MutS2 [Neoasaia chiangmaiensis NBRC 101099]|uniref:Uncharacterized protein n=1 Tax=Neoasaia chiangmaiensis TaxID=320497 RepID=A0A1U9KMX9_9PROT|nr:Smr/MutS family protein [Neoasaia chiangmaiensis]AQS87143.1 hypothetical protein A0U93_03445 [Neoasaia chiangmaiensis]GBR38159.1 DNA mismatch repair protein Smr/MutS2 [Neoasaia chiangmaiensis NBRC 101099]GEN16014.1 smr protein/Muts2-like [Neoasaia chiangmaiensis]